LPGYDVGRPSVGRTESSADRWSPFLFLLVRASRLRDGCPTGVLQRTLRTDRVNRLASRMRCGATQKRELSRDRIGVTSEVNYIRRREGGGFFWRCICEVGLHGTRQNGTTIVCSHSIHPGAATIVPCACITLGTSLGALEFPLAVRAATRRAIRIRMTGIRALQVTRMQKRRRLPAWGDVLGPRYSDRKQGDHGSRPRRRSSRAYWARMGKRKNIQNNRIRDKDAMMMLMFFLFPIGGPKYGRGWIYRSTESRSVVNRSGPEIQLGQHDSPTWRRRFFCITC